MSKWHLFKSSFEREIVGDSLYDVERIRSFYIKKIEKKKEGQTIEVFLLKAEADDRFINEAHLDIEDCKRTIRQVLSKRGELNPDTEQFVNDMTFDKS